MPEIIFKWFAENYPELIIFIIVAWGTWRVSRLYGRLEKVEEKCSEIEKMNSGIGSIKTDISKISGDLEKLFVFLSGQMDKFPKEFFASHSPIQLNPVGVSLLEEFGGKKFIEDNSKLLIDKLHENNVFKSALDVQNSAVTILYSYIDQDGFTPIKNWVFNNPVYKVGSNEMTFSLAIAINIMAIYLRDKYFVIYPELKDIDPLEKAEG
jgi:hypothetical protein